MTNALPTDILEQRAAEQRRRLHNSVSELRTSVKDKLDVRRNAEDYARDYVWQGMAGMALIGLVLGYGVTGIFTRY